MTPSEQKSFLEQFKKAHEEVEKLAELFPVLFDKNGKPIEATLTLPDTKKDAIRTKFGAKS